MWKFSLAVLAAGMCLDFLFSIPSFSKLNAITPSSQAFKHILKGKISSDRYYAYGGAFSILLPSTSETMQIEDSYAAPNVGGVAFFNDSGFFLKVEIDDLIPEVTSMITQHPEIKEEMLDALFNDALLLQIRVNVPKAEVLYQKVVQLSSGQPALFTVLDMPEAATLIDMTTGRGLDSKRGYLVFFANQHDLINMSLQDTLSFIPTVAEAAKASLNDRLLNHLLHYQGTLTLESNVRPAQPKIHDQTPMP